MAHLDMDYIDTDEGFAEYIEIVRCDDKERFLRLLSHPGVTLNMSLLDFCAGEGARKCLLALIEGEGCVPPAQQLYTDLVALNPDIRTPLACVACFPEACDIIELVLKRGPLEHANFKYSNCYGIPPTCPLHDLLDLMSYKPHLKPWNPGNSLYKLILVLCQWEMRSSLQSARLLVPHTDGINDIAWAYVTEGRLASLAALLLVAQEKVLVPFDSGLTIRQRIVEMLDTLSSEGDLDLEGAKYKSMLMEACKLLDIFERTGGALSQYCSSMLKYVPLHKVLIDIASVLKMAGYTLQPMDLDLRDCYSKNPDVYNASVSKVSNLGIPKSKYLLPSSHTRVQGFGATLQTYPRLGDCRLFHKLGDCRLFHKLKSGSMVNLTSSVSMPRLFSTVASQINSGGSGVPLKHFAYIAFRLTRGVKF